MHVRVARFEHADASRLDEDYEEFKRMIRMSERPEIIPEDVLRVRNGLVGVGCQGTLVELAKVRPRER